MPTVAKSGEWRAAKSTQAALEGAVVAMATIWATPAAVARSRTAGKSAANWSSSRCAWVSNRVMVQGKTRKSGGGTFSTCLINMMRQVGNLPPQVITSSYRWLGMGRGQGLKGFQMPALVCHDLLN